MTPMARGGTLICERQFVPHSEVDRTLSRPQLTNYRYCCSGHTAAATAATAATAGSAWAMGRMRFCASENSFIGKSSARGPCDQYCRRNPIHSFLTFRHSSFFLLPSTSFSSSFFQLLLVVFPLILPLPRVLLYLVFNPPLLGAAPQSPPPRLVPADSAYQNPPSPPNFWPPSASCHRSPTSFRRPRLSTLNPVQFLSASVQSTQRTCLSPASSRTSVCATPMAPPVARRSPARAPPSPPSTTEPRTSREPCPTPALLPPA